MENPLELNVISSNPSSYQMESQSAPFPYNSSPFVARLNELLFKTMLVGVSDGRFFMGKFHCIDKQGNILLQDTVEYRGSHHSGASPVEQRYLGLILIPSHCRTSCHVDCSLEEQMSLLSLENIISNKIL